DQAVMSEKDNNKAQDPNPRFAKEGCSVLLNVNDGDRLIFARLSENKNYSLKPLIGAPFGSLFQVETGEYGSFLSRLLPIKKESSSNNVIDDARDNRELIDNSEAQNLIGEEIEAMRREGANGDEIIEALTATSKTFDLKFQLSHVFICEAYFKKYPVRIGFLRVDALSLLLTMANVTAYSDVLVVDMVGGLVTGAVAE
ncbi:unnamed protein product, partial [Eruca vesicaria subsp. sativa]|nr:unnamed protein product [Eruca vesicaria subsp. sativa]